MNLDILKSDNYMMSFNLEEQHFNQFVDRPTHTDGGCIDHIYFRAINKEISCKFFQSYPVFWSDHNAETAIIQKQVENEHSTHK